MVTQAARSKTSPETWRTIVARYEAPSARRSWGQIANTILPYFALLYAMYLALDVSYWITLALAVPAAGFLVRSFIICHDCGHGSFFKSRRINRTVGLLSGLLTFVPFYYWTHEHARHHAHAGDLDRRGEGDIWTLTVQEYLALPRWKRAWYRIYRNPVFLFGMAPLFIFLVLYRFWRRGSSARERWSVVRTNLILAGVVVAASLTIGIQAYLMILIPVLFLATSAGVWLFYVQHQFENTYWARHEEWSYLRQALEGSSFYRLPRLLQWFTGNIGFHHVHHLSPRIPNYNLQKCHESHPMFRSVKHITPGSSLKALGYRLWDENRRKLVGFDYVAVYLGRTEGGGCGSFS